MCGAVSIGRSGGGKIMPDDWPNVTDLFVIALSLIIGGLLAEIAIRFIKWFFK